MASGARRARRPIDVWPGYVDVLAALLILVIFVLLLFSFAQFLLSQLLDEQETELDVMYQRVVELTDLLGLEQENSKRLSGEVAGLGERVDGLLGDKRALSDEVTVLTSSNQAQQGEIREQLLLIASLQEDVDSLRQLRAQLESDVGKLAAELDNKVTEIGAERDRSKALQAELALQTEHTLLVQRELEQREIRIQALSALVDERDRAIAEQRRLSADAKAEIALLNAKLDDLRGQLEEIGQALAAAEQIKSEQAAKIDDLGERLNVALAREVNRLRQYRSDFLAAFVKCSAQTRRCAWSAIASCCRPSCCSIPAAPRWPRPDASNWPSLPSRWLIWPSASRATSNGSCASTGTPTRFRSTPRSSRRTGNCRRRAPCLWCVS